MAESRDLTFAHAGERFEWDLAKAVRNLWSHGVGFQEAATAFADDDQLVMLDEAHSNEEDRSLLLGMSERFRLLPVAWTLRGDSIRIISARVATGRERRQYEQRD